ncbi:MAG: MBL fold metallo-hydrolase [Candidatus Puniceispirillaceae bacterium]
MKKFARRLAIFMGLIGFLFVSILAGCEQFGAIPKGAYLEQARQSPQYHLERDIFINRRPDILDTMNVGERFFADPFGKQEPNFLFNANQTEPASPLPEDKNPDLAAFQNSDDAIKFIWLGHSTILLSIEGHVILFDPIFSDHAAPLPIAAKRFQPPALALDDLPPIDTIIISHDHYDHLDMETVKYFIEKDVAFFAPIGVGSHLRYWGAAPEKVTELDWWEASEHKGITFTATPSQHFSGRIGVVHNNKTLWASWVVKGTDQSVYFSGDSGYDTHYKTIGERLGPFDLIFMENGQYNEAWKAVHNLPKEAITAFQDLGGTYLVPVHWGMFNLSVHNWYDPPNEITRLAKQEDIQLITPRLGQLISLDNPPLYDQWWLEMIDKDISAEQMGHQPDHDSDYGSGHGSGPIAGHQGHSHNH